MKSINILVVLRNASYIAANDYPTVEHAAMVVAGWLNDPFYITPANPAEHIFFSEGEKGGARRLVEYDFSQIALMSTRVPA